MKYLAWGLSIGVLFCASSGHAQKDDGSSAEAAERRAPRKVGLDDLIRVATRRAPALARARVDVAIAKGGALAAAGVDDWVVTSSARYSFSQAPDAQTIRAETFGVTGALAVPLPTGGVLSAELDATQNNVDQLLVLPPSAQFPQGSSQQVPFSQFSAVPRLRIQHPLLRGAGTSVARAGRKQAELNASAEALNQKAVAMEAVRQIVDAYWSFVHSSETLKIRQRGVALANEQLRVAQISIRSGSMPKSVARAVQHRLAVREQELLRAEVDVTDRALGLRRLVGLDLGPGEIKLATKDTLTTSPRVFDVDTTLKDVLAQHPRLLAAELSMKANKVQEKAAKDRMLPQLDVQGAAGPRWIGSGSGDAFSQIGSFDRMDYSAQVNFQYEIPMRGARGARAQAEGQTRRARIDREDLRRELIVAVVRGIDLVRTADKQVEVSQRALELAGANLKDEQARFRAGRTTIFEVLDRQDELQASRSSVADSMLAHRRAVATVESLTGDILDNNGIELLVE